MAAVSGLPEFDDDAVVVRGYLFAGMAVSIRVWLFDVAAASGRERLSGLHSNQMYPNFRSTVCLDKPTRTNLIGQTIRNQSE